MHAKNIIPPKIEVKMSASSLLGWTPLDRTPVFNGQLAAAEAQFKNLMLKLAFRALLNHYLGERILCLHA